MRLKKNFIYIWCRNDKDEGNVSAIRAVREEIYCLEIQIDVLQGEWDDVIRWADGGGDANAAAELFSAISMKRVNLQLRLEDARRRLLDLLADSY